MRDIGNYMVRKFAESTVEPSIDIEMRWSGGSGGLICSRMIVFKADIEVSLL